MTLSQDDITRLFTRGGTYLCARWGRPVAPVMFGLADNSLQLFSSAIRAAYAHAGHPVTETDAEMGANLMIFFCREWEELAGIPDLDKLTDQPDLVARLQSRNTNHYQLFRFDPDGAIRACLSFVRMSGPLASTHPAMLAETLAVRTMLTFAQDVTASEDLARLVRAAYDPVMPDAATDNSHAIRLGARLAV
ncbi:MAG: hypothetical protein DI616_15500 [Paracoccus denitrificans]|uniref:Uncharacterized protein n=1 Tax=Paracoccus denitrificans TaxID=266 RepID=A0A533I5N8_PARDE|nr:MAG: hypothetical protein DI616_15500 [Paracoccus denitrificans]